MFNLSAKAAKKFKISFSSLNSRKGNYWRIDTVIISRKTWLLCTHEPTLFTLILRVTGFKKLENLLPELNHIGLTPKTVTLGKGSNRKATGSMIGMASPSKRYQQWFENKEK